MKKQYVRRLYRIPIMLVLACALSVFTLGGTLDVGASSYLPEGNNQYANPAAGSQTDQTYDDKDKAWIFEGDWSVLDVHQAYEKQIHASHTIEDYAAISINGSQFTLVFSMAKSYGNLDIYLDNIKIHTIDQSKPKTSHQREWTSPEFASGMHVIKIVHASGTLVNIDVIKVRGPMANPDPLPSDVPTSAGTPTLIPSALPNSTASPFPTGTSNVSLSPSPTSLVQAKDLTSTASPVATTSSTPSQIPSPTASITPTITSAPQLTPTPTNTQIPTATSSSTPSTGLKAYYVSTTGNNTDGKSWNTAWNGLDQVNWSIIQPGDTIYISGGTTGATYNGGVRISKSGTAGEFITIDTGANSPAPTGHNGTVTIEGGDYCLLTSGSYLKVQNLICQHATRSGFRIEGTGAILENNTVRETYGQGIHVHYCNGCVVRGNRVTTFPNDGPNENIPYQTDGIVIYESSNTLIERNWVRLTNQNEAAHIDGIQASTKLGTIYENITIQYNYVENTKNMTSNSQGIYLTQMEGNVKIIGNVVYHPNGNQTVVSYLPNSVGSPVNVFVIGNTIKCAGYRCLLVGDDNPVIKNNIIWQTGSNQLVDLRDNTICNPANINNNLYYAPNSSYPFAGSCGRIWSDWHNSNNLDANGIFGQNPNLDSCFRPTDTSPSVGKGTILAEEYNQGLSMSLCGQNGPTTFLPVILENRNLYGGSSWDIGAYEH